MIKKWKNLEETVVIWPERPDLIEVELDDRIQSIEVDIISSGYDDSGRISADPDDSWAPESDAEIKILHAVAHYRDGNILDMSDEEVSAMSDSDKFEQMIWEAMA